MKTLLASAVMLAITSTAFAADLPRREPAPVAVAPVGKAPIGKAPIGKAPLGKGPVSGGPVYTKG